MSSNTLKSIIPTMSQVLILRGKPPENPDKIIYKRYQNPPNPRAIEEIFASKCICCHSKSKYKIGGDNYICAECYNLHGVMR